MSRQEVIAFLGKAGSGKGFQADRFVKRGYKKLSFADPLRKMACHVIGLDYNEAMKKYDELKKTPLVNNLTFRNILENLGSGVREIDEDFWVKAVIKGIRETTKNIVIDDEQIAISDNMSFKTEKKYVDIKVEANDSKAKVEFENKDLSLGENIINIVVVAENGDKKNYALTINKIKGKGTATIKKCVY